MKGNERLTMMEILRTMVNVQRATLARQIDGLYKVTLLVGGLRVYVPFVHYSKQELFMVDPAYAVVSIYTRIAPDTMIVPSQLIESKYTTSGGLIREYDEFDLRYGAWLHSMTLEGEI